MFNLKSLSKIFLVFVRSVFIRISSRYFCDKNKTKNAVFLWPTKISATPDEYWKQFANTISNEYTIGLFFFPVYEQNIEQYYYSVLCRMNYTKLIAIKASKMRDQS